MVDSSLRENLIRAVNTLATSPGPLNERLADAFSPMLLSLRPTEFPAEMREQFNRVVAKVEQGDANAPEGHLRASLNTMTPDELVELADELWELFEAVVKPRR